MQKTISEIIELIKQNKEREERTIIKLTNDLSPETLGFREKEEKFIARKVGYVEAYADFLSLLESSHLVEQEKAIDILKKYFCVDVIGWSAGSEETYYSIREKNNINTHRISKEEYDLLSGILKND